MLLTRRIIILRQWVEVARIDRLVLLLTGIALLFAISALGLVKMLDCLVALVPRAARVLSDRLQLLEIVALLHRRKLIGIDRVGPNVQILDLVMLGVVNIDGVEGVAASLHSFRWRNELVDLVW